MTNLGYAGLGVIGGNMVSRLLDKGHAVTGYERTRSKAQWLHQLHLSMARRALPTGNLDAPRRNDTGNGPGRRRCQENSR